MADDVLMLKNNSEYLKLTQRSLHKTAAPQKGQFVRYINEITR